MRRFVTAKTSSCKTCNSLRSMDKVIERLQDACGCQMRDYAGIGQILDLDQPRHSSCN